MRDDSRGRLALSARSLPHLHTPPPRPSLPSVWTVAANNISPQTPTNMRCGPVTALLATSAAASQPPPPAAHRPPSRSQCSGRHSLTALATSNTRSTPRNTNERFALCRTCPKTEWARTIAAPKNEAGRRATAAHPNAGANGTRKLIAAKLLQGMKYYALLHVQFANNDGNDDDNSNYNKNSHNNHCR